ncbi:MAG: 2-oxo acid dehydrogenase subunit E2 [Desulfomonile tiedjei]|nr:2-oxo acid dehydrogenase subunit E2 [Desulfomonile tiedjei]
MREVFRLPDVGEGIAQAEIVEYLVNVGDSVKADQNVVRIETDKAVVELPSPFAGTVAEIPHEPGDTVNVGDALLVIETEAKAAEEKTEQREKPATEKPEKPEKRPAERPRAVEKTEKPTAEAPPAETAPAERVMATPHTRRLARELGVDINIVKGSGPHGRITDEDVRQAVSRVPSAPPKAPTAAAVQAPATAGFDFEKYGPTRRVPLKGVRKRIAEVMARSVSTIPHVAHFDEADVTELLQVVARERSLAESRGIKLTILSFLAKAAAAGLKKHPMVNSSLDEETGELVFKDYINIGIATDTEAGLMVPVVRDVDRKSILEIAADLQELSKKARDRTIDLEDLRGGTFTITNVGAIGGTWATPIILHPQVAILASMRATKRPVVRDDHVVVRTMMPLTLSFDHRVLDGADSGRFINHVKELLEDPLRMLVDVA